MAFRPILKLIACFSALAAFSVGTAAGGEVTLALRTGGFSIIGELLPSEHGSFVIKSGKFGVISVETSKFECKGPGCPKTLTGTVAIHGSNTIGAQLMPATIEKFVEKEGFSVEKIVGSDAEQVLYKIYDAAGKALGSIELQSHGSNTAPPILSRASHKLARCRGPSSWKR